MSSQIPVACQDCEREGHQLRDCRIRIVNFSVFNRKCPRELALAELGTEEKTLPSPLPSPPVAGDRYLEIPLNRVFWKEPIRKAVKEEDIKNMAMSFTCHGQIEPIVVKPPNEEGMYEGVVGRLRYEGMKFRKGATILARIHPFKDDREIIEWQLAENLHRRDLTAIEKAEAYRQLYEEIKKRTGSEQGVISAITKSLEELTGEKQAASTVYEYMQISELPQDVKEIIAPERNVGVKHGRELLRLRQDPKKQRELAQKIVDKGWSVKKLKRLVDSVLEPEEPKPEPLLTGFKVECPECHVELLIDHREFPDGKIEHKMKEVSLH